MSETQQSPTDPMVPFLTGWLAGACLGKSAREVMKLLDVHSYPPDTFVITLASGLKLRVKVSVEGKP